MSSTPTAEKVFVSGCFTWIEVNLGIRDNNKSMTIASTIVTRQGWSDRTSQTCDLQQYVKEGEGRWRIQPILRSPSKSHIILTWKNLHHLFLPSSALQDPLQVRTCTVEKNDYICSFSTSLWAIRDRQLILAHIPKIIKWTCVSRQCLNNIDSQSQHSSQNSTMQLVNHKNWGCVWKHLPCTFM